jgi:hypothetical protein
VLLVVTTESSLLAVGSKGAAYFGGTSTIFGDAKDPIEGRLDTRDERALTFTAEDKPHVGKALSIPTTESLIWSTDRRPGVASARRSAIPSS